MSNPFYVPIWKAAPFLRLLLPLVAGILLQWYLQFSLPVVIAFLIVSVVSLFLYQFLSFAQQFTYKIVQGILIHLLLIGTGLLVTWQKDIRNHSKWLGKNYRDSSFLLVRINEPLIEKAKTWKAEGQVEAIVRNHTTIPCTGKILLYFSKDSAHQPHLHYGDKILVSKKLQPIKNGGNPGSFNYVRYAAFQQIFHHVFLADKDWILLQDKHTNFFRQFVFDAREYILHSLQKYVSTDKSILGIAEALLIGYTNDLDKELVQAYSNTGVVHVIAVSGMHLGLIYVVLIWVLGKIPFICRSKLMQLFLILSCLWLFSILTGASASVMRAAVMFTFITVGNYFFKQPSIYNSLAASAFVLLCYNPFYLWDVGFQLSYLAVTGIVVFQQLIYTCVYIKNKWLNKLWQLTAVSIAAQLLTFPVCIYYFHQFPNFFLLANILIVSLSGLILYMGIIFLAFSWIPAVSHLLGKIISWMVGVMNTIVLKINELPYAVWDKIPATVFSTWLLYAIIIGLYAWIVNKNKKALRWTLFCLLAFGIINSYSKWKTVNQQKIVVYDVPRHQAIDFISGNTYQFVGDSLLLKDGMLQNFHLQPTRIAWRLKEKTDSIPGIFQNNMFYQFNNKKIVIADRPFSCIASAQKIDVDIIIFSKNPSLSISQMASVFNCKQFIFDASNSLWKIGKWKKQCEELHLPFHSVPDKGAFVLDVDL